MTQTEPKVTANDLLTDDNAPILNEDLTDAEVEDRASTRELVDAAAETFGLTRREAATRLAEVINRVSPDHFDQHAATETRDAPGELKAETETDDVEQKATDTPTVGEILRRGGP